MEPSRKRFEDPTWRDWVIGIGLIVLFLIMIAVGAFLLIPDHWGWWLFLVFVGTLFLVFNQNRNYACRCRECGYEFKISFLANLTAPHGIDKQGSWLWVKCLNCERKGKVSVIRVVKGS